MGTMIIIGLVLWVIVWVTCVLWEHYVTNPMRERRIENDRQAKEQAYKDYLESLRSMSDEELKALLAEADTAMKDITVEWSKECQFWNGGIFSINSSFSHDHFADLQKCWEILGQIIERELQCGEDNAHRAAYECTQKKVEQWSMEVINTRKAENKRKNQAYIAQQAQIDAIASKYSER